MSVVLHASVSIFLRVGQGCIQLRSL